MWISGTLGERGATRGGSRRTRDGPDRRKRAANGQTVAAHMGTVSTDHPPSRLRRPSGGLHPTLAGRLRPGDGAPRTKGRVNHRASASEELVAGTTKIMAVAEELMSGAVQLAAGIMHFSTGRRA